MAIGDDFNIDYVRKMIYHDELTTEPYNGGAIEFAEFYDANATTYDDMVAELASVGANDVTLPPSQVTAIGDAIYIGEDNQFSMFRLILGTAGVYSGITLQWQYWNGSGWVELTVTDPTSFFTASPATYDITWIIPSDWATTAVDGDTAYWIRCVVTAHNTPSITTAPLGSQGWERTNYTVNQLYSWLMDTFDEQGAMDDTVPMSAQTPSAYSIINNWFIDDLSVKYLTGGAITQTRDDNNINLLTHQVSGYVNCVKSDITKQVVWDASDHGPLLAYDNTRRVWWVRTADSIGAPEACTINGGTGEGTATAEDKTGSDLFANIYTLGTIETYTDVYIYQAGSKITSWWNFNHVDVLVKVSEFGTEIDSAVITIYGRVYTDLYDFYEIDLTAGGRNAVPLATADDIDNATAVATILNLMDVILIMHVNGTISFTGGAGDSPVKHKVIRGQTSDATAFILNVATPFELASIEGGPFNAAETIEICEEIRFDAQTSQFSVGDNIDNGDSATATVRRVVQDPQEVGTEGILYVTNVTGTWSDDDPIEVGVTQYATMNGTIQTNTFTATTNGAQAFADTVDRDLDNGNGLVPYNVIIDCNGQTVANVYELVKALTRRTSSIQAYPTNGVDTIYAYNGEFYQKADTTYAQIKKASPYGTFAGGKYFGARGIWLEDMHGDDSEDYSLTDADNTLQSPPTSSSITVTAMIVNTDRCFIAESTGVGNKVVKKDQYTTTVQSGDRDYIEVSGAIADDAPSSGVVRVVRDYGLATQVEFIFNYTSIDRSGADDKFMISPNTTESFNADDRAYNPWLDKLSDASGEASVIVKYSGSTKYIVVRVRLKGYEPFEIADSFGSGAKSITAIRSEDDIFTP